MAKKKTEAPKKAAKKKAATDLMSEMAADTAPTEDVVNRVGRLATQAENVMVAIEAKTKELGVLRKEYEQLTENDIPTALADAKQTGMTLESGRTVELDEKMYISLTGKYKVPALKWLRKGGHEALISNELIVNIPKGKDNVAGDAMAKIEKLGLEAARVESVHTGSFKALIRTLMKEGKAVPFEKLGIHLRTVAKFK